MATESSPLIPLRPLDELQSNAPAAPTRPSHDWIPFAVVTACALTNNVFIKASVLPDGRYPFKWMNAMATVFTGAALISYKLSKNPFRGITPYFLLAQCLSATGALVSSYILSPMGLALTSVQVAAALSFTAHPFSAVCVALLKRKSPGKTLSIVILSAAVQIFVFVRYVSSNTSLIGEVLLLLMGFIQGLTNAINSVVVGGNFDYIDTWSKTFWYCIGGILMSFVLLPMESFLFYGELAPKDFLPGHNFNLQTVGLVSFLIVYNIAWVQASVCDARMFICSFFTGTVLSSLLDGCVHQSMDVMSFAISLSIYLNSLNYQLSYHARQRAASLRRTMRLLEPEGINLESGETVFISNSDYESSLA